MLAREMLLNLACVVSGLGVALAGAMMWELQTFKVKVSVAGNESFEAWRERDHDDLVLTVALAAWAAEQLDWSVVES